MVPFLYFLMGGEAWSGLNVPIEHQAALAHATSLAVIVPTAASGLVAFGRRGVVRWSVVLPLAASAAAAALAGAQVAAALPTPVLKLSFGSFLLLTGAHLFTRHELAVESGAGGGLHWWGSLVGGALIGFLSALLGVGGGIVAIPILIHWAGLDLHRVVPASIGVIMFAAAAGVASYVFAGAAIDGLPWGSVGFVHVPAALAMIPGAVLLAPLGARWNQRLSSRTLRPLFAVLLLVIGLDLVWVNGSSILAGLR